MCPPAINWWVDASFAVHPDLRSHTGATMTLGRGCPVSISTKQKINMRSSTEAELVGVNNAMGLILWTRKFLGEGQGFQVTDNVVFQDNQSTIKLQNNRKRSSGPKTRHVDMDTLLFCNRQHPTEADAGRVLPHRQDARRFLYETSPRCPVPVSCDFHYES